jgi:hypothetical protein
MYPLDNIRIDPLHLGQATVASTSQKIRFDKGGGGDFSILVQAGFVSTDGLSAASTIADLSATDAGNAIEFTVVEATAASAAGSAISGATLTLGPATVAVVRGGALSMLQMTSAFTTAMSVTINGLSYGVATAYADAANLAAALASAINGNSNSYPKLPHYEAIANDIASAIVSLRPDDDLGTGLTIVTTAAAATMVAYPGYAQGKINVQGSKLSTNTPKYIGVICGESSGVVVRAVSMVRYPSGKDAFPGAVVNCTT